MTTTELRRDQEWHRELRIAHCCPPGFCEGASVIKCCYAARDIGISSTVDESVDLRNANMTLIDFKKVIADQKISLNVSLRLVSPACIAGVLTRFRISALPRDRRRMMHMARSTRANDHAQAEQTPHESHAAVRRCDRLKPGNGACDV
jgi:hypothetical protein